MCSLITCIKCFRVNRECFLYTLYLIIITITPWSEIEEDEKEEEHFSCYDMSSSVLSACHVFT